MRTQVESENEARMQVTRECANCGAESKCRRREFSMQAWSVLLLWNEVAKPAIDQPICDDCYSDLREILIDRADDMPAAVEQLRAGSTATDEAKEPTGKGKKKVGQGRSKSKDSQKVA